MLHYFYRRKTREMGELLGVSANAVAKRLQRARASVAQAKAGLDTLSTQLSYATVRAPAAGRVLQVHVEEGGAVKCGVLSFAKWESMVEGGDLDPNVCRIVWTTPLYADYNWTAHPALEDAHGAGFTDELQKALIDLQDKQLLGAFLREAFALSYTAIGLTLAGFGIGGIAYSLMVKILIH